MDETILFPSPNWFLPSGLAVSTDEWVFYGGPSKSLCVLEPLPPDYDTVVKERQGYTAHVVTRAHPEKIVAVDICPEWPEKRCILTGSTDGAVKQWSLEKGEKSLAVKSTHSHEIHSHEKEEVVGVGYCKDGYAVTVGSYGHIVKWDLNSNVAKSFNHVLKNFKPVSMACSPHIHMHVAIGTKQGVLFVLDLNGSPRIVYKVRGQDDEIVKVSWCPQYEVAVRKALKESDKRSAVTERLKKIQQEPETPEKLKLLEERVKNSQTTEQPILINEKSEPVTAPSPETLNESGIGKDLPEDSFDETVVQEDDMFDIYKDHEPDEFGHKKFQPVDVLVKVTAETVKEDYLSECQKLKEEILQRKSQADASIGELVAAMDKTQIEPQAQDAPAASKDAPVEGKITKGEVESSVHIHKHLLATIGKHGSVRVWSKSGKLVGSCGTPGGAAGKSTRGSKRVAATTLHWARPDELLIADGNNQLLNCNPLKLDCKNKLEWVLLHRGHNRGLFAVSSSAPRSVRPGERRAPAAAWSAAQDRSLVRCCLDTGRVDVHMTCGGFLYTVKPCPYDAGRVSVSAGDGHVRVWEAELSGDHLRTVNVRQYWQNVQGKILVTAWHPRRENILAFATAEARVGLIDTSRPEKPATVLQPSLGGGIYSLSWGGDRELYASGGGALVMYDTSQPDQAPTPIPISLEGAPWEVSVAQWHPWGCAVGSTTGGVAVLDHAHAVRAANIAFNKVVYMVEWHPFASQCTGERSELGDLLATCSLAKPNNIAILEYTENEDGTAKLSPWKLLSGHKDTVLQVSWSPHCAKQLLSTSQDGTVRIWDITTAACTSIFGGHVTTTLGATWLNWPSLSGCVLSGGADCSLRLWQAPRHPHDQYQAVKYEVSVDKKGKKNKREREEKKQEENEARGEGGSEEQAVSALELKRRYNKKFLLPMTEKQTSNCDARAPRKMLHKYSAELSGTHSATTPEHGLEFLSLFGNINDLNRLLDTEMERHIDTGNEEAWVILGILRGTIDAVISRCAAKDALDPLLLSVAPCVSFKYWKDATLLYLQQIDRLLAKGEDHKLSESKQYGGALYRKVAALLSLHDVRGAVTALCDARLYKEALVLSRTRYMESLAEQAIGAWAQALFISGNYNMAAVCYIALGNPSVAAATLGKSTAEDSLLLAADIAKVLGQNTLAGHIHERRHQLQAQREIDLEQNKLEALPTRADIILKEAQQKDAAHTLGPSHVDTQESGESSAQQEQEKPDDNEGTEIVAIKKTEDLADDIKDEAANDLDDKEMTKPHPENKVQNPVDSLKAILEVSEEDSGDLEGTDETITEPDPENTVQNPVDSLKDQEITEVNKEASGDHKETDKTEEILAKLPEKIEGLLKEPVAKDVVPNGTHKGEGDAIQNGAVGGEINIKVSEKGDEMSQRSAKDNVM